MTDISPETSAEGAPAASNRHRAETASPARARGAIIALVVSAIGAVGFVVGLRAALHLVPPERPAGARAGADSVAADSAARARYQTPPQSDPDAYPRLR